ncbi:conserved hypothetical protein [Theileria orientalis strain Shintoku]|uniref:Uncharacterized protein n=1 Tax=Theileria orientalis strain Shintoku TaxID=869250 RepID=J4C7S1_THEOR|nr:conserved hypothetical protein [Theileria orientalis strain Shintoku]BAM39528.1 conserved hypothetical protein [Theileria orientalis strain Shintoku]|eukprot:XP_009689829.1 conserved hypothetical protein [Theileria orientalis strain Shintoku]
MRINGFKKRSTKLDESFFHSMGNGVVNYNDSEPNKPIKSLKMSNKRLLLSDSENIGIMCKRKPKIDSNDYTPNRMTNKTILDVLMNRDDCLYEIDDVVLEEYCLLATPTDRRYKKGMDKHTELNTADLSLISTTDHDSTQNEFDKIGGEESIESANEEIISLDSGEVADPDADESINMEIEAPIDPDVEGTLRRTADDELIKCVLDKEYFEGLERVPAIVPSEEGIEILAEVLSPSVGKWTVDGSLKYKLFVLNVAIQILKENKLKADDLFASLLSVLKSVREEGVFGESRRKRSEEELFESILDNSIYVIRCLKLDELVELFKEYFPYCYRRCQKDMMTLRAHGVCKEIVRRLQVDQIKEILSYVASNIVYFNNNVYNNVCKIEETKEVSKSQIEKKMYNSKKEDCNIEIKNEIKNELGNKIFVNVVIMLFERIFIGSERDKEGTLISEVDKSVLAPEGEESYLVFKEVVKRFIEEAFYKEGVEFESYRKFIQMLLANLESPTQMFTPFLVLEMARVFMAHLSYEGGRVKRDVENRVRRRDSTRLHSLKLLMVISTKIFGIYNEMRGTLRTYCLNSKYLGDFYSEEGELQAYTDEFTRLKDYIINYVSYINIDSSHVEWSRMDTYVFYILLKKYCYEGNVQEVDDLRLFIKIFKHLYKHNGNYKGDLEKMLKNINYDNVINYPYSPSVTQVTNNDVEGYGDCYKHSCGNDYKNSYGNEKIEEYMLKVYVCNGLYELYDGVVDSVVEVINNANEQGIRNLSIDFMAEITLSDQRYLLNRDIREVLMSSMLDSNTYVRQQIINMYSNCIVSLSKESKEQMSMGRGKGGEVGKCREQMLKYIDKEVLSRIVWCTKDVNYKIRAEAVKLVHCYLSIVGIKDCMDVVSELAQRIVDTHREHPRVKKALYNLMCSVFFKYAIEIMDRVTELSSEKTTGTDDASGVGSNGDASNLIGSTDDASNLIGSTDDSRGVGTCKQLISDEDLELLEKLVKILLYKMESYNGTVNPIVTMMSYYESNQKAIKDPISYYYQVNGTFRENVASKIYDNDGVIDGNSNSERGNMSVGGVKSSSIVKDDSSTKGISSIKSSTRIESNTGIKSNTIIESSTSIGKSSSRDVSGNEEQKLKRSEDIVRCWLEKLLDVFLYKRAEGRNYYELAEILTVFKQFGEVHARLFVKHLVYFIPYLRIINDTKLEVNQVNLIILINNLVIIVYKYLKEEATKNRKEEEEILSELKSISNSIMSLVNYNSPILIRSIIQLMSYNNVEYIEKIREESYNHLETLKKKLQTLKIKEIGVGEDNRREDDKGVMKMLKNNRMLVDVSVYKSGWQLGCISEFNEVDKKVMKLFIEMYKLYTEIEVYNISGLFIECCCRYLSNIGNLYNVDHEEFKRMLSELYEYCKEDVKNRFGDLILILKQMLNVYKTLSTNSEKTKNVKEKKQKEENEMDVDHSNMDSETAVEDGNDRAVEDGSDRTVEDGNGKGASSKSDKKRKQLLKVLYVVMQKYINLFTSTVTNYYNIGSRNGNKRDGENSKLYMDIVEVIVVNRLTSVQEIVPFVFGHLLSADVNVQRVAEQNIKLIIKQDVSMFLNRLNGCFVALLKEIAHQFYENNRVLGVLGTKTEKAVQSIFRIYVEVLEKKRANTKIFITSLVMQTKVTGNQEIIESIKEIIVKNSKFNYSNIKKMNKAKGEERKECVVEYILSLYVNLICTVLEGITFKSKREANFAVARIKDVVEENRLNTKYTKIKTEAHTRLKKIARKIKNIYK